MTAPDTSLPASPEVAVDPLLDTIAGSVADSRESPTVMRIGVVAQITEATNITVRISGSEVLVTAAFQFPQYAPVLGDRVVVLKQDSQWFCIGLMSGDINSLAPNADFEAGALNVPPPNWTFTVTSSGAGTPVIDTNPGGVDGIKCASVELSATAVSSSSAQMRSDFVTATPDMTWTTSMFVRGDYSNDARGQIQISTSFEWFDAAQVLLSTSIAGSAQIDHTSNNFELIRAFPISQLLALGLPPPTSPPGTSFVRLLISFSWSPLVAGLASYNVELDRIVLRPAP